jgi:hypothetical protein
MNTTYFNSFEPTIALVIKAMTILALIVYALFAFILISQIKNKQQSVTTKFGFYIELLSYIHFGLSIGLIILALILL